jgi:hypothetical protein
MKLTARDIGGWGEQDLETEKIPKPRTKPQKRWLFTWSKIKKMNCANGKDFHILCSRLLIVMTCMVY